MLPGSMAASSQGAHLPDHVERASKQQPLSITSRDWPALQLSDPCYRGPYSAMHILSVNQASLGTVRAFGHRSLEVRTGVSNYGEPGVTRHAEPTLGPS